MQAARGNNRDRGGRGGDVRTTSSVRNAPAANQNTRTSQQQQAFAPQTLSSVARAQPSYSSRQGAAPLVVPTSTSRQAAAPQAAPTTTSAAAANKGLDIGKIIEKLAKTKISSFCSCLQTVQTVAATVTVTSTATVLVTNTAIYTSTAVVIESIDQTAIETVTIDAIRTNTVSIDSTASITITQTVTTGTTVTSSATATATVTQRGCGPTFKCGNSNPANCKSGTSCTCYRTARGGFCTSSLVFSGNCNNDAECASGYVCVFDTCIKNTGKSGICMNLSDPACSNNLASKRLFARMPRKTIYNPLLGKYVTVIPKF